MSAGKVFIAILAVFLLLGAFASPIREGIEGWRTDDTTEAFSPVTTAAGVTSANVTLAADLFQDSTSKVVSVSSNTTETPVATSYDAATNYLLISALDADTTRTLTINYYADVDDTVMAAIGPFLTFLIFGGLLVAIGFGVKSRRG